MYISRHAIFNELEFSFQNINRSPLISPAHNPSYTLTILPSITSSSIILYFGVSNSSLTSSQSSIVSIPSHHMITRNKINSFKLKYFSHHHIYSSSQQYANSSIKLEPTYFTQASKHSHGCQAMSNELTILAQNATWDLVSLPEHANTVGCKWLFKIKRKDDGSIERYNARLIAKGYTQEE
jgi:Reverse transcriptase (RNA-dependent DNA polymerase)